MPSRNLDALPRLPEEARLSTHPAAVELARGAR